MIAIKRQTKLFKSSKDTGTFGKKRISGEIMKDKCHRKQKND
jgi:hypothetical protein